ncbi:uncharacterized protein LOC122301595 [Carya illinoinensis]|uniref:uncharacterized protein LOC122301595 n=1 Tax=Carya illinoinensis TaxID=32201 RepID=UPI001C71B926|nr:uncharacterized protein LOC122301595 [Carya illinoinensis]
MKVDELAKRWEKLNLSKEESKVFHVQNEAAKDGSIRGKHCIIGKVLSEKGVNNEAFRTTMSQVWRLEGWVRFKDLGDLSFLIEFQWLSDKEKVLSGRPWFFDRHLLALVEVDEAVSIVGVQFNYEPFWVQLHNLPLAAMTEAVGEEFGSSIGHVIRVEAESDGLAWGRCLRVRVAVDLHKPSLRGRWLQYGDNQYWISFKYERLQSFCFNCGVLCHKGRGCSRQRLEQQGERVTAQQYGPWLRAQPMINNDGRKYGGSHSQNHHSRWQQGGA